MDIENRSRALAVGFVKTAGDLPSIIRLSNNLARPITDSNLFKLLSNKTISGLENKLNVSSGMQYLSEMVSSPENRTRLLDALKSVAPSAKATAVGAGIGALFPAMTKLRGDMHAGKINRNNVKQYFKDNIGTYGKNSLIGGAVGGGLGAGVSYMDNVLGTYNNELVQEVSNKLKKGISKFESSIENLVDRREHEFLPAITNGMMRNKFRSIKELRDFAANPELFDPNMDKFRPMARKYLYIIDNYNNDLSKTSNQVRDYVNGLFAGHKSIGTQASPSFYNIYSLLDESQRPNVYIPYERMVNYLAGL